MTEPRAVPPPLSLDAEFREHRTTALVSGNLNTFWSITIIILAFGLWDYFVDPLHWRAAFIARLTGALIVTASGLIQKQPGKARLMPQMARLRLVVAVITSAIAAAMLDTGYGYGVAGLAVVILTGPYIAVEARDLLQTNVLILAMLLPLIIALGLPTFDVIGTLVFVVLAMLVSTLLSRVLEGSYRRAFMLERELHRDARTDALTGLDNRRSMQERGRGEVKLARRTGVPVSVILCDLDHFKSINDKHGHETGDTALVKCAAVLRAALRESDALGRWGGEEFIAVLPATNAKGAHDVAERMRAAIEQTTFANLSSGATISLGVATSQGVDDPGLEWDLLIKEADQRLYRAKHEGRNRVVSE